MFIALDSEKNRIRPQKGVLATCPCCGDSVVAKMGRVYVHHWAHKELSDCEYGRGMTQWHYRWIERHFGKPGWEVEYFDRPYRYDCYNTELNLVLEIQTTPLYDYIVDKTDAVLKQDIKINWIFHQKVLSPFKDHGELLLPYTRRRLVLLDILERYASNARVQFYVDRHAENSKGKSSRGLIHLKQCLNSTYWESYYRVPYEWLNQDSEVPVDSPKYVRNASY